MFLTTRDGVVLVDAPPTIGHNLLRAIGAVTQANGRPSQVTHLVYSHSHADHIGASILFGPDVVRIGHRECRTQGQQRGTPRRIFGQPRQRRDDVRRESQGVAAQKVEVLWPARPHIGG